MSTGEPTKSREGLIADAIAGMLPPDTSVSPALVATAKDYVGEAASGVASRIDAKAARKAAKAEAARLRKAAKAEAEAEAARAEVAEEYGVPVEDVPDERDARTVKQVRGLMEASRRRKAVDAIEAASPSDEAVTAPVGASKSAMDKLYASLGINLNLRLTKNDTANLLACLLTCDETQLRALAANPRVPVAIKTVIRRVLSDAATGDTSTVERLWDRLFGKGAMTEQSIAGIPGLHQGLLPDTPVSREAYVIIRESLMK